MRRIALLAAALLLPCFADRAGAAFAPAELQLADDGRALHAVVVGPASGQRTRAAAQALAEYLGKISGASFKVTEGDGRSGIAVGLVDDFPELPVAVPWEAAEPTQHEDYLLQTHQGGALLLGATEPAVEHAVWDILYRLGYRQFFPGPTWEVVPRNPTPSVMLDDHEHPDYYARRIWYGGGIGNWSQPHYEAWRARNRAQQGIDVPTGHAYDGILRRNREEFEQHPQYLGLFDGKRDSTKFCISNAELRALVAADALRQLEADSSLQGVSVDPSDGGRWCQCDACARLGSVSNRAVLLANTVAEAVTARHPDKWVAMYAYNEHSPPPTIDVHPRVIINVATAFIRGDHTVEELLAGWQARGATVGIREYYSVHTWDRDLPGRARGGNLTYLADVIPRHHALGARFLSAESSDNWGPNGLGYYAAARVLWDVDEAARVDAIRDDFLTRAFERAAPAMRRYYEHLDTARRPLLSDDLLGRMLRALDEARQAETDQKVRARVNDLVLYTRYCELWFDYETASGSERQAAFEAMARHALRMRGTLMIHTLGLLRDVPTRDRQITMPAAAHPKSDDARNPWLDPRPFDEDDIEAILRQGIERRQLLDFTPLGYSDELVPAAPLRLASPATGSMGLFSRGERTYHTWVDHAPAQFTLEVRAGIIYNTRGPAELQLFPRGEPELKSVALQEAPPDKSTHRVEFSTSFPGEHRLVVSDRTAGTSLAWPDGMPMTVVSSIDKPAEFHGRWTLCFYVPRGTRVVGGFAGGEGRLLDADGKLAHTFARKPGYFSVPVPPGHDGRLWTLAHSSGQRLLMTVPPCLARNAAELLLPREVVQRDAEAAGGCN